MSRRAARELVLHMLFQQDFTEIEGEALLRDFVGPESFASLASEYELYQSLPGSRQTEYIHDALTGVIAHRAELDGHISAYAVGWNLGRISRVARCILRLAMYEIGYLGIPMKAAVNEALELAKQYDSEEAAQFVNGILASYIRDHAPPAPQGE